MYRWEEWEAIDEGLAWQEDYDTVRENNTGLDYKHWIFFYRLSNANGRSPALLSIHRPRRCDWPQHCSRRTIAEPSPDGCQYAASRLGVYIANADMRPFLSGQSVSSELRGFSTSLDCTVSVVSPVGEALLGYTAQCASSHLASVHYFPRPCHQISRFSVSM